MRPPSVVPDTFGEVESYGKRAPDGPLRGRSSRNHPFSTLELGKGHDSYPQELPKSQKTPQWGVFSEKARAFERALVLNAFELLVSIVKRAEHNITLIDGYVDEGTLNILAKKRDCVAVSVWTHPRTRLTQQDVATFNTQYPTLEVRHTASFHDRFLILDNAEGYLVGASLKDAGARAFAVSRIEDGDLVQAVLTRLAAG